MSLLLQTALSMRRDVEFVCCYFLVVLKSFMLYYIGRLYFIHFAFRLHVLMYCFGQFGTHQAYRGCLLSSAYVSKCGSHFLKRRHVVQMIEPNRWLRIERGWGWIDLVHQDWSSWSLASREMYFVTSCLVVSLAGRSACVTLDWLLRTGWCTCVDC